MQTTPLSTDEIVVLVKSTLPVVLDQYDETGLFWEDVTVHKPGEYEEDTVHPVIEFETDVEIAQVFQEWFERSLPEGYSVTQIEDDALAVVPDIAL